MTTPFQGLFVIRMLQLAMINPYTKVCMSTHYEDMKGNAKCRNWDDLVVTVTQRHQQCLQSIERIRLPIWLWKLCVYLVLFLSYSELSKLPILTYPTCIWRPSWGAPVRISWRYLASETRAPGLPCDVACVIQCLAVLMQYRRVTDRQTVRQTMTANTAVAQRRTVKFHSVMLQKVRNNVHHI